MNVYAWTTTIGAVALAAALLAAFCLGRASQRPRLAVALAAAASDPLTGVANRTGLLTELDRRARGRDSYGLLLVDLDGFKAVNDTFGHAAGDAVLTAVAGRLATLVAGVGMVARLGGDEFVAVATSPVSVMTKLLGHDAARLIARPVPVAGGGAVVVRASVGVVHAGPGEDARMLLAAADVAMYRAKTTGGGVAEYDLTLHQPPAVDERPAVRLRDLVHTGRDLAPATAAAASQFGPHTGGGS